RPLMHVLKEHGQAVEEPATISPCLLAHMTAIRTPLSPNARLTTGLKGAVWPFMWPSILNGFRSEKGLAPSSHRAAHSRMCSIMHGVTMGIGSGFSGLRICLAS